MSRRYLIYLLRSRSPLNRVGNCQALRRVCQSGAPLTRLCHEAIGTANRLSPDTHRGWAGAEIIARQSAETNESRPLTGGATIVLPGHIGVRASATRH